MQPYPSFTTKPLDLWLGVKNPIQHIRMGLCYDKIRLFVRLMMKKLWVCFQ